MTQAPEVKQHYHLFTVEVAFRQLGKPETTTAQAMNVLRVTDDGCITAECIGQVNVAAQTRLHTDAGEIQLEVLNCVVLNVSPLGLQTQSHFEARTATAKPELEELLKSAPAQ